METSLNFRPHPCAVKMVNEEAAEAKAMNRLPRFTTPEEIYDTQCLFDGDELLGYCGYKPGMGLCIIVPNLPASFVGECVAFLTAAHGGPPKKPGKVPQLVADVRNAAMGDGE